MEIIYPDSDFNKRTDKTIVQIERQIALLMGMKVVLFNNKERYITCKEAEYIGGI